MTDKTQEQLKKELNDATRELRIWEDHDLTRRDGSQRQDRMHEERGRNLRSRVSSIENQLSS